MCGNAIACFPTDLCGGTLLGAHPSHQHPSLGWFEGALNTILTQFLTDVVPLPAFTLCFNLRAVHLSGEGAERGCHSFSDKVGALLAR